MSGHVEPRVARLHDDNALTNERPESHLDCGDRGFSGDHCGCPFLSFTLGSSPFVNATPAAPGRIRSCSAFWCSRPNRLPPFQAGQYRTNSPRRSTPARRYATASGTAPLGLIITAARPSFAAIARWASFRCRRWRLRGHGIEQVEIRTWPEHEVVVIRHDFAVIALARNLPKAVAHLARLGWST